MSFLAGSVSAVQFSAAWPDGLTGREVEVLARHAAEPCVYDEDGECCGWTAGGHRRDVTFGPHNVVGDFLAFDFRRTTDSLPAALIRDYTAEELAAVVAGNDGRPPSARQKRVARERARELVEEEARDGRFRKHKVVPVVWDRREGVVWFGAGGAALADRFAVLFGRTFGVTPVPITPATLAGPDLRGPATAFVPGVTPMEYAWSPDLDRPDHLGNEFALWLVWRAERDGGEVCEAVVMAARTMALACPRGQTGRGTVSHEWPVRLPEVRRALQAGKLPRGLGLTLAADGEQYELTLQPDRWAITAGRLPAVGDDAPSEPAERRVVRLESVRSMLAHLRTLFVFFCQFRADPVAWAEEVDGLRRWLGVAS